MKNPVTDVLPAQVRKILYAILFVAAMVFALWQASEGDWAEFVGGLLSSLLGLMAASNTDSSAG